jgi:hypothetical protein
VLPTQADLQILAGQRLSEGRRGDNSLFGRVTPDQLTSLRRLTIGYFVKNGVLDKNVSLKQRFLATRALP